LKGEKKMKKEKNKIIARVGATVAALVLVLACALPCFAASIVEAPDFGSYPLWRLKELFYSAYDLNYAGSPLKIALEDYNGGIANTFLTQFTVVPVGYGFENGIDYITVSNSTEYDGIFVVTRTDTVPVQTYAIEHADLRTSHTTRDGKKFVYFDIYETLDGVSSRSVRIRIKIDNTSGVVEGTDAEIYGSTYTDVGNMVFGLVTDISSADVLQYGFSENLLEAQVHTTWKQFTNGLEEGYYWGYGLGADYNYEQGWRVGYNDGRSAGIQETMETNSIVLDTVSAIFRAPMELIDGVLDFNIMGINLAGAVHVIITMAIIGVVVTIIWKAVK
jgi:hypothetical protein